MTKLVDRLLPVSPNGEVIHGEGRVPRHLPLHPEEGGQGVPDLVLLEGGEGLEEDEALAPGVAGGPVDVELVLLALQYLKKIFDLEKKEKYIYRKAIFFLGFLLPILADCIENTQNTGQILKRKNYWKLFYLEEEAPPGLEDGEVGVVPVREEVKVVPLGDRLLHLNGLALHLRLTH